MLRLKIGIALSLIPQLYLIKWLDSNKHYIDEFYSLNIYPKIATFNFFFFNNSFISIGDVFYLILLITIFYRFYDLLKKRKFLIFKQLINLSFYFSIFFFLFHFTWGLNYYKTPLSKKYKITSKNIDDEIFQITKKLLKNSNDLHKKLSVNKYEKVNVIIDNDSLFEIIKSNFKTNVQGDIKISKIKKSIFSKTLSYMGFSGYINPFTHEAQINSLIPQINKTITIAHEISHQFGFASEQEANFIAFINTFKNKNDYVRYSANIFAFKTFLNALKKSDYEKSKTIIKNIRPGVLKNIEETKKFWKSYENFFEPYAKKLYDLFLKINGQKDGIVSYTKIVSLIIAHNKIEPI